MTEWKLRCDAAMPYQHWNPFSNNQWVEVANASNDTRIGKAADFWWGYETEFGAIGESVITRARAVKK